MQAFSVCAAETEEGWSGEVSAWFILEKRVTAEVGGKGCYISFTFCWINKARFSHSVIPRE